MQATKTAENKPQKIARALAYLRVSTDEQAAGLDGQLDAIRAHTDRLGLDLVVYKDEGVSGSTGLDRRPGLLEALGEIGPGDILVVAKRDRLARDPIVSATIEAAVNSRKARIVSVAGEGTDGDGPSDILFRRLIDAFAEYERLVIKARTRSALSGIRARGRKAGEIPYGKEAVDDGQYSKSSVKRGAPLPSKLVDSEPERIMIRKIEQLSGEKQSPRQIAKMLDEMGYKTRRGGRWHHNTIRGILARIQIGGSD